jgi:hypothetical protein
MIPRVRMEPAPNERLSFPFTRLQFPVRPAFAMTINKAQGQTFRKVGLQLSQNVFTHGSFMSLCREHAALVTFMSSIRKAQTR